MTNNPFSIKKNRFYRPPPPPPPSPPLSILTLYLDTEKRLTRSNRIKICSKFLILGLIYDNDLFFWVKIRVYNVKFQEFLGLEIASMSGCYPDVGDGKRSLT